MPVYYSKNLEGLEESLGYKFKNKELLLNALIHKSYHHENPDEAPICNERLEFLGDAVLGLAISEILYQNEQVFMESDMSKMKAYLVRESVLYEIASKIALGKYLLLGKGEEFTGGRSKKSILSDAVEAIFGAIFLDSDYEKTRSVIQKLFKDKIDMVISKKEGYDFKTELQERCQGLYGVLPEYKIVKQEGEEHKKIFTAEVYIRGVFFGRGMGRSKKDAQMNAAKEALKKLMNNG
jgi:ribonuclease-3